MLETFSLRSPSNYFQIKPLSSAEALALLFYMVIFSLYRENDRFPPFSLSLLISYYWLTQGEREKTDTVHFKAIEMSFLIMNGLVQNSTYC